MRNTKFQDPFESFHSSFKLGVLNTLVYSFLAIFHDPESIFIGKKYTLYNDVFNQEDNTFSTEKTNKDNCHCEFFLEKTGEFQVEEEEKFSFANKSKIPNKEIGQKAKAVPFSYNIDKIVSKSNSSIIYQV